LETDAHADPHRRFNPLTREWVLVSPHRAERPWRGRTEVQPANTDLAHDPECYLCPGNGRAQGARNPQYESTFVFTNDFPALKPDVLSYRTDDSGHGLLLSESESGTCRVVCFSPRHDLTLGRMEVGDIAKVVNVWTDQYTELGALPDIDYIQIFENRGEMMGCSNPHPHGQIWASRSVPNEPLKEQQSQRSYAAAHGSCLLCDYLRLEQRIAKRIVLENDSFVTLVPFWAVWPFEVLLLSKQHLRDFVALDQTARVNLAEMLKSLVTRYDNLFETPFAYSMGFHPPPSDGDSHSEWHFHAHFFPPLLRSATIRKFIVGYEMLAGAQRDITPESAADTLRYLPDTHYTLRK
jgi:UDPglucose--hexose-1-phosphate uridylyltransferase